MKTKGRIIMVDDDELIVSMLARSLKRDGYEIQTMTSPKDLFQKISSWHPDLLFLDIDLREDRNGLDILSEIQQEKIELPVVMLTADDTAESAIRAMKLGAADYLLKPFNLEEVKIVIDNTLEHIRLREEVQYLRKTRSSCQEQDMVSESAAMKRISEKAAKLATAQVQTILITGESGTGKEVLARFIHNRLQANDQEKHQYCPFIAVNCTALPENLIESELFGHTKGAFTDAKEEKKGVFELADGGTLLLDEIGDMRLDLQSKFLRVLEDRKVRRLGGKVDLAVEVSVIATTNADLKDAVIKGKFREDLFYRLSTFHLHLPPLRDRKDDILPLARHFLHSFANKYRKKFIKGFSPEAEKLLLTYGWRGNIRELKNVIEQCVVLESAAVIMPEHLPMDCGDRPERPAPGGSGRFILPEKGISLEEVEKDLIQQALDRTGNNQTQAAKLLKVSYDALRYQAKKYGLL